VGNSSVGGVVLGSEAERIDLILDVIRKVLAMPDLAADDEVMDHGGTSLSIVRILAETKNILGLNINPRDLGGAVTARSLAGAAR
jgi:Phosphopantetheine attachment site